MTTNPIPTVSPSLHPTDSVLPTQNPSKSPTNVTATPEGTMIIVPTSCHVYVSLFVHVLFEAKISKKGSER